MAGVAPPATLSVVSGFANDTLSMPGMALDWATTDFDHVKWAAQPNPEVLQVASLAAESVELIPPTPPAANSSFHV